MKTWIVIAYRQYGRWSLTAPFSDRGKAERHAKLYLESDEVHGHDGSILVPNSRRHIQDITYIELELPE